MALKLCKCGGEIKEFDMLFECIDCNSKVWKLSHGHEFKEKEATDLLSGKVLMIKRFKSQNGSLYDTKAQIKDGDMILIFDDDTKSTKMCDCDCGGEVIKIPKGYKCTSCEKIVWEKFVSSFLKLPDIKKLYKGESLYLNNLKSKKGNKFNAEIYFEGLNIEMEYLK
jgi:Zn finger protein HypA/HybF involved in hydrogenase expression